MAIPSAAGYPQYSGSLIHPVVSTRVLTRLYESAITPGIADTSYYGEIRNQGDQITFMRSPSAVVRRSTKGGQIVHDTLETTPLTITIDHALEASVKVDPLDKRMIKNWSTLEAGYREDLVRRLEQVIDSHVLTSLYAGNVIAPENRGASAGVITGSFNLGSPGAPIVLTSGNIVNFLLMLENVFRERNIDIYRETPWLTGPPFLNYLLMTSELRAALTSGLTRHTVLMNSRISEQAIAGFHLMLSNNAPRVYDPVAGRYCYHLLGGLKRALAFAFDQVQAREIDDVNDWMKYTQSRYVYGFGVVYPEFLIDAYVTFDQ